MITIQHTADLPDTYPLERLGPLSQLLFFDIETTGFSGDTASLYLIGCAYHRDDNWHLIQWFADTPDSEPELLDAFFTFLRDYSVLIHFNGDRFDLPFVLKRCRHLGLSYDFSGVTSIDIYRKIQPYRTLLGLESMKQKAIERFLGIFREDPYSGGQLIQVYYDYLAEKNPFLYKMLILHNEEDLKGMPLILPILSYCDMLEGHFVLTAQSTRTVCDIFGNPEPLLSLIYESPIQIPVEWSASSGPFQLEGIRNHLTCTVALTDSELKLFYPDYQNYYYLPAEDTAIHKSIGDFVDRTARKKATPSTCYVRRLGLFLPLTCPAETPVLKHNFKDKQSYIPYDPALFQNPDFSQNYLQGVLTFFCPKGLKAAP